MVTLKGGIENLLKQMVPGVREVVAESSEPDLSWRRVRSGGRLHPMVGTNNTQGP